MSDTTPEQLTPNRVIARSLNKNLTNIALDHGGQQMMYTPQNNHCTVTRTLTTFFTFATRRGS